MSRSESGLEATVSDILLANGHSLRSSPRRKLRMGSFVVSL